MDRMAIEPILVPIDKCVMSVLRAADRQVSLIVEALLNDYEKETSNYL
jgi:hypothetical protein